MKYYAVIDTNVLVSSMLKWDSVPGYVMQLVYSGSVIPVVNEEKLDEYEKVLKRAKFGFELKDVHDVLDSIRSLAIFVNGEKTIEKLIDPKDVVFYEVVMEKRKTDDVYLVTGNIKHFPVKPFVVTPRQFMEIIVSGLT